MEGCQSESARIPNLAKPGNTLLYRFNERRLWPRIESTDMSKCMFVLELMPLREPVDRDD